MCSRPGHGSSIDTRYCSDQQWYHVEMDRAWWISQANFNVSSQIQMWTSKRSGLWSVFSLQGCRHKQWWSNISNSVVWHNWWWDNSMCLSSSRDITSAENKQQLLWCDLYSFIPSRYYNTSHACHFSLASYSSYYIFSIRWLWLCM